MDYIRQLAKDGGELLSKMWGTFTLVPAHMQPGMTNPVLPVCFSSRFPRFHHVFITFSLRFHHVFITFSSRFSRVHHDVFSCFHHISSRFSRVHYVSHVFITSSHVFSRVHHVFSRSARPALGPLPFIFHSFPLHFPPFSFDFYSFSLILPDSCHYVSSNLTGTEDLWFSGDQVGFPLFFLQFSIENAEIAPFFVHFTQK